MAAVEAKLAAEKAEGPSETPASETPAEETGATLKHAPVPVDVAENLVGTPNVVDDEDEAGKTEVLSAKAFGFPVMTEEMAAVAPVPEPEPVVQAPARPFGRIASMLSKMSANAEPAEESDPAKRTAFGMPAITPAPETEAAPAPAKESESVDNFWADLEFDLDDEKK
jgi:hypothetical protein